MMIIIIIMIDDGGDDICVANFLGFWRVLKINESEMPLSNLCIFDRPNQSQEVRRYWCRVFTFAVPYPVMLWHLLQKPEISVGINDKVPRTTEESQFDSPRRKASRLAVGPLSLLNNAEGYSVCSFFHPLPIHATVLHIPHMPYGVA